MRQISLTPVYVVTMPENIEEGKLYISKEYGVAIHLCACGCKAKTVTPLGEGEWTLTEKDDKVSFSPSIGNFMGEKPDYHAHYIITDNVATFV